MRPHTLIYNLHSAVVKIANYFSEEILEKCLIYTIKFTICYQIDQRFIFKELGNKSLSDG